MTLTEIRESHKTMLVPADVADVLECMPYSINTQAQTDPSKLGFPVCVMGNRVKIPREAFLYWLQYGNAPVLNTTD